jgi:hypothetical protein
VSPCLAQAGAAGTFTSAGPSFAAAQVRRNRTQLMAKIPIH